MHYLHATEYTHLSGGINSLYHEMAVKMGLSDTELTDIVSKWRKASPNIVKLWSDVEKAVIRAVEYRTSVAYKHNMLFSYKAGMLRIRLASGREISYVRPHCNYGKLSYEGTNQTSRKWERLDTYGGKLVENIVQAPARECLAVAMTRLSAAGFKIVMHVHDEVIIDCKGTNEELNRINKIMGEPIDWAPGLILSADGYITGYYKKD